MALLMFETQAIGMIVVYLFNDKTMHDSHVYVEMPEIC